MPINKNALIRYRTIDKCLQNRRRKWTIEQLITACNDALYEYEGIDKEVSLRTIRMDLQAMRSDKLGYNAPIIVTDKKYYSYEDADYSIANVPLSQQDLQVLQDVSHLLQQFKGFSHFADVNEMIQKLEDKIYTEQFHEHSLIDFEKNDLLVGLHWLDILYKAIASKTTLTIMYQSFKARDANEFIFYPYLLKEYRNRWFLLGVHKKGKLFMTLALDRMVEVALLKTEPYYENKHFNAQQYFKDIIGVTRSIDDKPIEIQFKADAQNAPYIKTKPIHHSQQIVSQENGFTTFSITVIPNLELERELFGFGEGITILSPNNFVRRMKKKVRLMHALYYNE